ncbi:D-beta-hydroxybutyrate dehydrogenase, mitochondrial-like isoform X1 [Babylonia areolata]|uniref:D-beta-hydroxybutyrate dehydrogenase, mitochondrial-like isoform X1 n=2 Tax=Babylonia areolata TaxID=304850 RepID=UPI003FD04502
MSGFGAPGGRKVVMTSWELVYALQAGMVGLGVVALYSALTTPTLLCVTALLLLYPLYCRQRKRAAGSVSLEDRTVLVTGCDSGFGHDLAKALFEQGCHVIATVYRPDGEGAQTLRDVKSDRMTVLPLDVSSDDSVAQCLRQVKEMCKDSGLWGLVNNAGHNFVGEVELTTMRQYLMVANINIFGMVRTTRAFLPLLRQARGRIVNITSIKGQLSTPVSAAYNLTKYAGETFSEITRMEMKQFGVKVIIVEPGDFGGATGCLNKEGLARIDREFKEMWDEASDEVKEVFSKEHLDNFKSMLGKVSGAATNTSLTPVIHTITEALTSGDPDLRYIVDGIGGWFDFYCMMVRVKPFLSDRLFEKLLCYFIRYKVE